MIRYYNTETRKKEEFRPIKSGRVGMYTCGPTVYDYAHIGNLRAYCFEDLLRRHLEYHGYEVTQVMNITDVDDKIIKASNEAGIGIDEFTAPYIRAFYEDLDALGIEPAEFYPRATEHIQEMVELVKKIMDAGVGYRGEDGSIYFSISAFPSYGRLSHIKPGEQKAGARIKHDEYDKESIADFALWKSWDEKDGEVYWETELGKGRPGWHIECSAMSMKYLGESFDIHTGGVDNIFPHHENEIAQSETATGKTFVKLWMHNEHLLVNNRKMAKSLGNFYTLRDLIEKGYDPLALRYMYISTHYRSKLNFTLDGLKAAERTITRLYDFLRRLEEVKERPGDEDDPEFDSIIARSKQGFLSRMDDDLNSSAALAYLFDLETETNRRLESGNLDRKQATAVKDLFLDLDRILGLKFGSALKSRDIEEEILSLIKKREMARKEKNYKLADEIRNQLKNMNIILEDTPQGTRWKKR
ncbi:MAG: cysteine--tRNA ligase [Candidatus Eremiobacteraeota bacterium]|nr:cysteine--tRNA ligase [Candidatus Eremiobacteraeota bacterium]